MKYRKWQPEDVYNLLTQPIHTLLVKYPDQEKESLVNLRRYYIKKLAKRSLQMEQNPEQQPERGTRSDERLDKIAELLERSGISIEDIGRVNQIRVGTYQMLTKDNEGEAQIHDLEVANITYTPQSTLDEQVFVTQAEPTIVRPTRAKPRKRNHKVIASIPDTQIGYRNIDGELVPIHDERAISVARTILKEVQPDVIVAQGDNLDLAELSHYLPDSTHFINTLQASIDRVHRFYAELRADNPSSQIVEIDSNHNARLVKFVLKNAMHLAGVRRANLPEEWGILTYPFLTRLDELGVQWISGYPAAEYRYADDLIFIHGKEVRSNGSTAELYSKKYPETNVVFGHVHRQEAHTRTMRNGKYLTSITFGTLARTDGAVPSYHNGVDDRGQLVHHQENWQQGIGIIHDYGDGNYQFQTIQISKGRAFYDGKEYSGEK